MTNDASNPCESQQAVHAVRYPGPLGLFVVITVLAALGHARYYAEQMHPGPLSWYSLIEWHLCFYPWVFLCPVVFKIESRLQLCCKQWKRRLLFVLIASVLISFASFVIGGVLTAGLRFLCGQRVEPPALEFPVFGFCLAEATFWSAYVAGYVIRSLMELQEKQRESSRLAIEKAKLEAALRQSELEVLRMRLNPHFLFNSLQNISVLAQQDPRTASRMLTRLGDLLRASFRRDTQPEVTLEAETALARSYIEMEQMRFGEKLRAEIELEPESKSALVPSLLLQPLVENAILHGLEGIVRQGCVAIRGSIADGSLILSVSDNGIGPPVRGIEDLNLGVGLGSTRDRLARMYPGRHEFSVRPRPQGGTEVRIAIPLRVRVEEDRETSHEQSPLIDRR
jgi:sensor histidine kinase YesM